MKLVSLRFIYGRAGSGKSRYCLNDIKARIDKEDQNLLILLVPEQFSLQAEINLVKTIGKGGIIGAEVLSFKRMAYRVFNEIGGITHIRINSAGKCMIIHKVLENLQGELKMFSKSAEQQGFINTISNLIAEFKRYNVIAEDLENLAKREEWRSEEHQLKEKDHTLADKLRELSLIYREYEKDICGSYRDADDDLTMLYEKLDETSMFNDAEIWIDEFSGFTTQEHKIISKLMKKAGRVNISLCTDYLIDDNVRYNPLYSHSYSSMDYTDVFSPVRNTVEKLMSMAKELDIPVESPIMVGMVGALTDSSLAIEKRNFAMGKDNIKERDGALNYRFKNSKELEHLEKYFYSFPIKQYKRNRYEDSKYKNENYKDDRYVKNDHHDDDRYRDGGRHKDDKGEKTKDISIFTATNIYSEIEYTARDIICLCRDEGLRYRDMAVVCGDLDNYEKFIKTIFTEYNIPFFIDKKRDINKHPLIQLITSVFEISIYNWSYESVFSYVKTGLTGIPRKDIDLIENYVLACGIRGNRWTMEKDWDYIPDMTWNPEKRQEYEPLLVKINSIRNNITVPLREFYNNISERKTTKEICESLYYLLCILGVPGQIDSFVSKFEGKGELGLAGEYRQIWNIVMEVFDQVVELMEDEKMDLRKFLGLLKTGFGEYKTGLIPPSLDQVLVGNIERSKSHDIKALYILGVNDGVFPSPSTEEGILSDRDRRTLQSIGVELAKDTRTKAFEDQFMVYSALTTPEKYLKISVPIADHEGRTLRPSIVISRLRKLFPNILENNNIVQTKESHEELQLVSGKIPTYNQLLTMMRKAAGGNYTDPLWKDVYKWYESKDEWKEKCIAAHSAVTYSNLTQPLGRGRALKLYGSPVYSSVSRLEQYASCPFSYYMQYGLGVKERKVFNLTLPDIGTFLHRAIEKFSRHVSRTGISWRQIEKDWCKQTITEITDSLLENMEGGPVKNGTKRYRTLVRRLDSLLLRAVWVIIEHIKKGNFEPIGYEMNFGEKGGLPPIKVKLSSGEIIRLTGRIDRIDALKSGDKAYLRIVDYKSGSKAFSLSNVYYGIQLQLITYLNALWKESDVVYTIIKQESAKYNVSIGDGIITNRMTEKEVDWRTFAGSVIPGGIFYFKIADPIIKGNKGLTEIEIESLIMKELKMNGLLLADADIVKEMDRDIDGHSLIIPARMNKGDVLGKTSQAATIEQFNILREYVRRLLEALGEEMLKGDISIRPYKNKNITSCKYCDYASVCQFDPTLPDNKYRIITDRNDDEIWDLMNFYLTE